MKRKFLIAFVLFCLILGIIFVYFLNQLNQKNNNLQFNTINNEINNQKMIVNNELIQNVLETKLQFKSFENFNIIVNIKPMLIKNKFFAYTATINPKNKENISAVDISIDKNSKTIFIDIFINNDYLKSNIDIETSINYHFIIGLLYAQTSLENNNDSIILRPQLIEQSQAIYNSLVKENNYLFIKYE